MSLLQRMLILAAGLFLAGAPLAASAEENGSFTTNDGVRLHYIEAGTGKPLVLIPGWSQTAEEFKFQTAGLSRHFHVFAIDMRGHGDSDKPDHGYDIERLAEDVHEFLVAKNLTDIALLGHSMGCSVIWSYWELFGKDRIGKLVLVDQMPMITSNPAWSAQELQDAGSIFDAKGLYDAYNGLAGPDGLKVTDGFVAGMFTKQYSRDMLHWVIEQNLKMPRKYAAWLLYNHSTQDWRHVIPLIDVPTLVIGGKASLVPWKSQLWVASQIKGAKVDIFEESEGGSHFMFMENPDKFNRLVEDFVAQ